MLLWGGVRLGDKSTLSLLKEAWNPWILAGLENVKGAKRENHGPGSLQPSDPGGLESSDPGWLGRWLARTLRELTEETAALFEACNLRNLEAWNPRILAGLEARCSGEFGGWRPAGC